jgi:FAD/FMN-containing dehydrogenase
VSAGAVAAFAEVVGPEAAGPVVAIGGGTGGAVGGPVVHGTREVKAPTGVVAVEPAEMTVRVGAGTAVRELQAALASAGQRVALPARPGATVGGVLAVGRSGVGRLGWGPVRNAVLEIRYVSAAGEVVTAGGPTVKNVSGYDMCRLLVGSLGTLGLLAEVVLRTTPVPAASQWFAGGGLDPFVVQRALHGPVSVLWDGTTTWVQLEGHPADVAAQAALVGLLGHGVDGPPPRPGHRWSMPPADLASLPADGHGSFVAEVGVGVVHRDVAPPVRELAPPVAALHARLKAIFDPTGRLAPGRMA